MRAGLSLRNAIFDPAEGHFSHSEEGRNLMLRNSIQQVGPVMKQVQIALLRAIEKL